nr:uncharacterized protein LOC104101690 [Nicotiana tomentosiformis]
MGKLFGGWQFISNLDCHYNGRIVVLWRDDLYKIKLIAMTDQIVTCNRYSWNDKGVDKRIFSKIDWIFINDMWLDNMPTCRAILLPEGISDHCPIKVSLAEENPRRKRSFQYCNTWSHNPQFVDLRSKAVWIKLGDDNTQYFYSVIKHRKLKHSITQLKDRAEEWQNKPNDIARIFVEYYEDLLEKRDDSRTRVNNRVLQEGTILTIDQQMELLQPYTDKDVKKALFNIDRNKSFGPDGYGSGFFRDAWDIIGTYFTEAVLKFYQNGQLLKQINSTNIALIPKIEVPEYDLMLFCKGNMSSVNRLMKILNHFSATTGLIANMDKSNIFLAGIDDNTKEQLLQRTRFVLGALPMKYLGLPLSSKKWNKMNCHQLVEKITHRVKVTYSRQLSYAGRLQVIEAVLFSIQSFWSSVFILPQSVLKEVDRICREYLWGGSVDKVALLSWEKICQPKKLGGLNTKGCKEWNIASVGKLIWQLQVNKESLWVKWVHSIYMKT